MIYKKYKYIKNTNEIDMNFYINFLFFNLVKINIKQKLMLNYCFFFN